MSKLPPINQVAVVDRRHWQELEKELGARSREQLEALFGKMYAGWDRGVNMEGPDTDFRETLMTAMELEARYVAAEIGVNIFELGNVAAFAPIIIYRTIQKILGPVFAAQAAEITALRAAHSQDVGDWL